ncbi:MAG: 16S rRNA processing protein RimM [Candidatus Kinetoplastibacterium crithidii]|nr:MAG: 16S rRNA processing protein RimM [Candidatus Kinetoplastibacterium crithidii]
MFDDSIPSDLIELGKVVSSYGIRGSLKVYPYSDNKETLLSVSDWWFSSCNCQYKQCQCNPTYNHYKIISSKEYNNFIIINILGVSTRDDSDKFRNSRIYVSRNLFPNLKEDEYYWVDLIGCKLYGISNCESVFIGMVTDIFENGAHPILCVLNTDEDKNKEILIPFVKLYIDKVDLFNHEIFTSWSLEY